MNHEYPMNKPEIETEPAGQEPAEATLASAEQQERKPTITPRIWVGSLSDYNNSVPHGAWLDAAREPEELEADIHTMLASSPWAARTGEPAEEWEVRDTENFGDCNFRGLTDLHLISRIGKGIAAHGLAFAAWACHVEHEELLDDFDDAYLGHYDNLHSYIEQLINDLGYGRAVDEALPASIRPYVKIDITATAHDLVLGGDIFTLPATDGGVWVFTP